MQIRLRRLCIYIYAYTLTFVKEIEFAKENTCQVSDRHLDYHVVNNKYIARILTYVNRILRGIIDTIRKPYINYGYLYHLIL